METCIRNELLRPHQQESVRSILEILRSSDSAVEGSDTGTGKTWVAIAVASKLQLPTLVVVPKISITNWLRTAEMFGEKFSVINYESLRTGRTPYGTWEHQDQLDCKTKITFVCEICQRKFKEDETFEPCPYHPAGMHCFSSRRRPRSYGLFRFDPAVRFLVFDEVHRCGGLDSLNADLLEAAKRQKIKHLIMSATLAQSVLGLKAIGRSLDLHNGDTDALEITPVGPKVSKPSFYKWAGKYGVRRDPRFRGLKWFASAPEQKRIMSEINTQIFPARGVRVRCEDIPGFPEQDITAELYDLDNEEQIRRLYAEMESAISDLRVAKEKDKAPESAITKILRARQEIELLKIPLAEELIQDSVEKGFSVCVFCNFRQTVECVSKRLDAPFIDGTVTGDKRQRILDSFQRQEIRRLVLNSAACGVSISLQDLDGGFPRMGYIFPSFSATDFRQTVGRFRRDSGKSKSHFRVILAANTIETRIKKALDLKLSNLDSLIDGDLSPV